MATYVLFYFLLDLDATGLDVGEEARSSLASSYADANEIPVAVQETLVAFWRLDNMQFEVTLK